MITPLNWNDLRTLTALITMYETLTKDAQSEIDKGIWATLARQYQKQQAASGKALKA